MELFGLLAVSFLVIAGGGRFYFYAAGLPLLIVISKNLRYNTQTIMVLLSLVFCIFIPIAVFPVDGNKIYSAVCFLLAVFIPFFFDSKKVIFCGVITGTIVAVLLALLEYTGIMESIWFVGDYEGIKRLQLGFDYPNTACAFLGSVFWIVGYNIKSKIKYIVYVFLILAMILTLSRIGLAVFALSFSLYLLKRYRKRIIILYSLLFTAGLMLVILGHTDKLIGSTLAVRIIYWLDALKIIASNPFGIGWGNYTRYLYLYQSASYYVFNVHNSYIDMALNMGLFGAFILIVFFSICFYRCYKTDIYLFLSSFVILTHAFFDFDFMYPVVLLVLSTCMSICFDYRVIERIIQLRILSCLLIVFLIFVKSYNKCDVNYKESYFPFEDTNVEYLIRIEDKCKFFLEKGDWLGLRKNALKLIDEAPYAQVGYDYYATSLDYLYKTTKDEKWLEERREVNKIIEKRNLESNYFKKYWKRYVELKKV